MWGTASVSQMAKQARNFGYTCLALTDTDNLYGMWPFIAACEQADITPVIGAEITDRAGPDRAVCLVKTAKGYACLTRLLTRRHQDKTFCLKQDLPAFQAGLLVLTKSADLLAFWHDHGVDLAAHMPRTAMSRTHPLCRTAGEKNIPVVASPGSFFAAPEDIRTHTLLRAIRNNTCTSRLSPAQLAPANAFFGGPSLYARRFHTFPEAVDTTHMLAEKITFHKPDFGIVMPPFAGTQTDAAIQLRQKTLQGAAGRYGTPLPQKVMDRIEHELAIIVQKNFCAYFLVVQKIVSQASRTCGRGSGAASIVAYCLGITNVCPIKFDLYFERFLNPGRQDPPDIDIDFAWDERDSILQQVLADYPGHAAMVSSHILFQPKMAVRETAKVFGLPEGEISRVCKRLPWFWRLTDASPDLLDHIRHQAECRHLDFSAPWPEIMALAQTIIGIPRYLSVHPGGVVITPEPIHTYVPVEIAAKGIPVIQWDKDGAQAAGLVKIDLLGNRSLGVIRDTITAIETRQGTFHDFDIQDPEDDPATCRTVARGDTMGCFYIESPAMRLLQKKSQKGDFGHVVIHSSMIRPAANRFITEYIRRLHTGNWQPLHPLLADVLNETLGLMVFQEDVSRVAVTLAGFNHTRADGLRKILSKKDNTRKLQDYYQEFAAGAASNGVSEKTIQKIWHMILSFAGYSFCKPHSASYARVSFQAAYLKTHYPAHFMAAVISNQGGFYSTFAYVSEARRMGVTILPPDVRTSHILWQGKERTLQVGLMAVRDLSKTTMKKILHQRNTAPFNGFTDFLNRVTPRENEIQSLIHSGSLDCFNTPKDTNRSRLLWGAAAWQKEKLQVSEDLQLFDPSPGPQQVPVPDLPLEKPLFRLRKEFHALGFLCVCHPIILFQDIIARIGTIKADQVHHYVGKRITFAGWPITGKKVKTRHGDPMTFRTFEDETGILETVFFPEAYYRFCHMLGYEKPYFLTGTVMSEWGAVTLTVETARLVP
jgi:error-prone DNA polymerase